MQNCNNGVVIPILETDPCNGERISAGCVVDSSTYVDLSISANSSQQDINQAVYNALQASKTTTDELQAQIDDIPINDGSETKVNAGTNVTVTGNGTIATPYIINSISTVLNGTYTPIITNVANVSNITSELSSYIKVGNIVTVRVGFEFNAISANTNSQITITFPLTRSNSHVPNIGNGAIQPFFQDVKSVFVQTDDVNFARCSFFTSTLGSYIGSVIFQYTTDL